MSSVVDVVSRRESSSVVVDVSRRRRRGVDVSSGAVVSALDLRKLSMKVCFHLLFSLGTVPWLHVLRSLALLRLSLSPSVSPMTWAVLGRRNSNSYARDEFLAEEMCCSPSSETAFATSDVQWAHLQLLPQSVF